MGGACGVPSFTSPRLRPVAEPDRPRNIPAFLESATYCKLESDKDFAGMLRRITIEHRKTHPRAGVFISYAHGDESIWIDTLLDHLAFIKSAGVQISTDREMTRGALAQ